MSAVEAHRVFSKTNLKNNNNKFWKVWFYNDGSIETQNGRQGAMGQRRFITATGQRAYEKKVQEKLNKGYIENEVVESTGATASKVVDKSEIIEVAKKQITIKNPLLSELIDYFTQVNIHTIAGMTNNKITYDSSTGQFKTAVGVISSNQVDEARRLLNLLADDVSKNKYDSYSFEDNLNKYLSLIPRDFGRYQRSPQSILPDLQKVQQENDLLDGLAASFVGVTTAPKTKKKKKDDAPKVFNVEMDLVSNKKTINRINSYYNKTKKRMHQTYNYKLKKVYEVNIKTVTEAFNNYGKKINNIQELFHGTKCSNLLSILKGGLIIPPSTSAHVTGRLYGNGIYASDISSKALNYATNFWKGGGSSDRIFMFLCDFAMGKIYYPTGKYGVTYPPNGYDSTFAKAGQAGVYNNEMIVYHTNQVNLKYLLEFE